MGSESECPPLYVQTGPNSFYCSPSPRSPADCLRRILYWSHRRTLMRAERYLPHPPFHFPTHAQSLVPRLPPPNLRCPAGESPAKAAAPPALSTRPRAPKCFIPAPRLRSADVPPEHVLMPRARPDAPPPPSLAQYAKWQLAQDCLASALCGSVAKPRRRRVAPQPRTLRFLPSAPQLSPRACILGLASQLAFVSCISSRPLSAVASVSHMSYALHAEMKI